jgi:hypothetical protein
MAGEAKGAAEAAATGVPLGATGEAPMASCAPLKATLGLEPSANKLVRA